MPRDEWRLVALKYRVAKADGRGYTVRLDDFTFEIWSDDQAEPESEYCPGWLGMEMMVRLGLTPPPELARVIKAMRKAHAENTIYTMATTRDGAGLSDVQIIHLVNKLGYQNMTADQVRHAIARYRRKHAAEPVERPLGRRPNAGRTVSEIPQFFAGNCGINIH